jgi:hypothetical protein
MTLVVGICPAANIRFQFPLTYWWTFAISLTIIPQPCTEQQPDSLSELTQHLECNESRPIRIIQSFFMIGSRMGKPKPISARHVQELACDSIQANEMTAFLSISGLKAWILRSKR